jgi:hypothetical protein
LNHFLLEYVVKKAILAFVTAFGLALLHSNSRRMVEKKQQQDTSLVDLNVRLFTSSGSFVVPASNTMH